MRWPSSVSPAGLAPEQVAAKLSLQLFDGAGQRWLRHIAFIGSARVFERPRDREKIPDLMHFHDQAP
jgi:hypothetical protein